MTPPIGLLGSLLSSHAAEIQYQERLTDIRMTSSAIIILFSGLSAASSGANGSVKGLLTMLSVMRFFLGVGLGAEYPSGSVSASEQSEEETIAKNARHRWFALATDTAIDTGFVVSAFVPLVFFWIFGSNHLRAVWRMSLGFGMIPALAVFLWRLSMDEPLRYKKDSMKHAKIPYLLVIKRYWNRLAAISFIWYVVYFIAEPFVYLNVRWYRFLYDLIAYVYTTLSSLTMFGMVIPGFRLTKNIAAFAVLYGIFLSFGEFGPGDCLGILASKACPTAVRGHYYGIAAAIGKVGAFVGTWMFPPIVKAFGGSSTDRGNTGPFWIGSGVALLSALVTLVFVKPLSPEGIEREDQEFREYLEQHGYDTTKMGMAQDATVITVEDDGADKSGKFSLDKA
ncbi:hypothetical protein C0992_001303 [Termitomyces sp. T32_za158]|nr:hypothetical protein C0992_001303 [Termitomyces sp. T32_za158]